MEDFWVVVLAGLKVWVYLIVALLMVPAMFGFSLGISETYMKILVKTLEWATLRIQTVNKEQHIIESSSSNGLIQRDDGSMEEALGELRRSRPKTPVGGDFTLSDCFYFYRRGIEDIVEDEVTQRFSSEELVSWNLLTRTNIDFQYISLKLTMVWGLGVFIRYCILAPLRITLASIGLTWLVIGTTAVGFLPNWRLKSWLSDWVHVMCYRICARGLSCTIHYYNKENRPRKGGICVANHTSPIDIVILCNDGCYAMVGQSHGGLMGVLQRAMARSCPHIWFERADMKDRHLVAKRLTDHVNDNTKLPILIFPEGTCINNTSVMMFKKGSFEIGGTIYPVAIKYDPQFGDAFWNSAKYNMVSYLLRMMTSWAIVCNVWYLPAMTQQVCIQHTDTHNLPAMDQVPLIYLFFSQAGEDAVQFANRVKSAIAHQGGLVDLSWDGGLKRAKVKDMFKEEQQKMYSSMVVGSEEDNSSHSD
ncbi:glycerol-3-phosphate acyltransferase 3-like isoform X1 [Oncorhynchus mykiss]|uniref:glycerol-3-phosphate acyltransferase 3-like isoform X1 n=1 Tax=Oncorhynchus mykiss TaxID=8022 RepID=UPI001878E781|nr:glycerol-3-phosphate acyltransferase 3-like isoform X1 [Oncorhynchus mykiss]XP_021477712.2 glycerol-3-phosphate acyltransferase 3-like isoform X1 [Oncorhynchus mykiss]